MTPSGIPRASLKIRGETYDLIIVGGGISGLTAAHFYRKAAGPKARILILENHDDFGGHAKRNEFRAGNRTLIGYGGTYSIETPEPYSEVARGIIEELGIDVASFPKYLERKLYGANGRSAKIFFDKETFGADKLVDDPCPFPGGETYDLAQAGPDAWTHFLAEAPIAEQARKDVARLCREKKDYLPALNLDQKKDRLARISYARFLTELVGVHPDVIRLYQTISQPLYGVGIEAVAALDASETGYPGFTGMGLRARRARERAQIFLPLSRRQCQHRASAGAQSDSGSRARKFCDRRSHCQSRLCKAG